MLDVKEVTKSFGGLRAIDNVSFQIEEGELSSIIGPNGAGKTTLFNLLTGHLRPDSGRVIFKGTDITKLPRHRICHMGIGRSFQVVNIFPTLSVFENIQVAAFVGQGKGTNLLSLSGNIAREETEAILEIVGLSDKANAGAGELSYGDQRRLEIGIALGGSPSLLLLDEPTAGLAPEETVATTDLIERLAKERSLTIVFIEHDMNVVFGISDKIRVMDLGKIIATGTSEEIKHNDEVQRIYLGEEAV